MDKKHGLKNPLGCSFCKETFSGKAAQMSHINSCEELKPPRRTKDFFCPRPKCGKRYVDEVSLANHIPNHDGKIVHSVCAYCGKTFANSSSLQLHIKNTCQSVPTEESPKRRSPNNLVFRTFKVVFYLLYSRYCTFPLVTDCESKTMMEFAVHRSDYGSIHYRITVMNDALLQAFIPTTI